MKKLKLLLLILISGVVGLSFSNAFNYTFTGHFSANNGPSYGQAWGYFPLPNLDYNGFFDINFDCYIDNLVYDTDNNSSFPNFVLTFNFMKRTSNTSSFNGQATTGVENRLIGNVGSVLTNNDKNSFLGYNSLTIGKGAGAVANAYSLDYYCELSWNTNSSCDYSEYESTINTLSGNLATCNSNFSSCESNLATATGSLATCQNNLATATGNLATCNSNLSSCESDLSECTGDLSCSVSDKIEKNIIFSGSKSFSNVGYTNMFNYGDYGAGTYCLKFSSTSPQTLSMGFANGGTTAPTNLYSLYNDQYGNRICLYGNKPYLNVKLNSSSNIISYEVYKLTDLLDSSIPCSESPGETCDYSEYESTISILSGNLNICQNSLNSSSNSLNSCQSSLNSCLIGNCPANSNSWSALYVNTEQLTGAGIINIDIPDEIGFDYEYQNDVFDLNVEGYNVDYTKISKIVDVQKYIPTTTDFTKIINGFGGFGALLVAVLFVVLVFYFVKKLF